MALGDVSAWMEEYNRADSVWYVKRLSGNDTLANGTHQGGPYVPKSVLFSLFPEIHDPAAENPDRRFPLYLDSDPDVRDVRAVWYNNKLRGGTRSEARLTGFGGRASALLDPESTGAIAIFAFLMNHETASECHVWISHNQLEEDLIEARTGPVEPRMWTTVRAGQLPTLGLDNRPGAPKSCAFQPDEIPAEWQAAFPTDAQIAERVISMRPAHGMSPDQRILSRRKCEQDMVQSVEDAVDLPRLQRLNSIDLVLQAAELILQRRKARSARSLHLHTRLILLEEGFQEGRDFDETTASGSGATSDFVFPNARAYGDKNFPSSKLRILAPMVTCRDRWQNVLNYTDRVGTRHLLTLQEGVSENQFRDMSDAGVVLVVPEGLKDNYNASVRPHLLTFESFIGDLRILN